jgi:hypothetical protein
VAIAVEVDLEGGLLGSGERTGKATGPVQEVVEPRRQLRVVHDLGSDFGADVTRVRHLPAY